jgi:hypothetical protein
MDSRRWFASLSQQKQRLTRMVMQSVDGIFDVGRHFQKQSYFKKSIIALLTEHARDYQNTNKEIARLFGCSESTVQEARQTADFSGPLFTQKYPRDVTRNRISEGQLEVSRRIMRTIGARSGRPYLVRDQNEGEFYQRYLDEFKKQAPCDNPLCKQIFYRLFYSENYYRVQIGPRHNKCPTCRELQDKIDKNTITPQEKKFFEAHKRLIEIQNAAHRRHREDLKR